MKFALPLIPQDKANHAVYGIFIYGIIRMIPGATHQMALIVVFLAAVIKEIVDQIRGSGTPEFMDLFATCAPGILMYIGEK